jgi:hypothetical protein
MPARQDGGMLRGGAPRVVWLTSESDPHVVSARSVAADLIHEARPAHLVWNPCSGEVVQLVPATRAAAALGGRIGREGRVCVQIMVMGSSRDPFTTELLAGLDEIMRWLDSWGVSRRWPAGPPLPVPQSYHSGRRRRDWARGGHFGASQVPETGHPDPGAIDVRRITGPGTPMAPVPQPRPVPSPETAADPRPVNGRITARRTACPPEPVCISGPAVVSSVAASAAPPAPVAGNTATPETPVPAASVSAAAATVPPAAEPASMRS